jgi:hypothetical protein
MGQSEALSEIAKELEDQSGGEVADPVSANACVN